MEMAKQPSAMRVRLLFFGMLKEVSGREGVQLEMPDGSRVSDFLGRYGGTKPELQPYYDVIAVAVNQEYREPETVLHDGDEVALIPPVSGGVEVPVGTGRGQQHESGRGISVKIVRERIDTHAIVDGIKRPDDGAVAVFEGIVRNHSRNRRTLYLDYE